jgi:hypothetical protein
MLYEYLQRVEDNRRGQGRQYGLAGVLVCVILALLSNAKSYRQMAKFIEVHFEVLNKTFGLGWKKPIGYGGLRRVIHGVNLASLEEVFRQYSADLASATGHKCLMLACDGKTLRGSFDGMADVRAVQILTLFATDSQLILAHQDIAEKSNEIPAFQGLIQALGLQGKVFTIDAMHTQKKQF